MRDELVKFLKLNELNILWIFFEIVLAYQNGFQVLELFDNHFLKQLLERFEHTVLCHFLKHTVKLSFNSKTLDKLFNHVLLIIKIFHKKCIHILSNFLMFLKVQQYRFRFFEDNLYYPT